MTDAANGRPGRPKESRSAGGRCEHVGFFLVENYSMMSLVSAVEPLRAANRHLQNEAYHWSLYSLDGGPVAASNGLTMETMPLPAAPVGFDQFFVCAGLDADLDDRHRLNAALHRLNRQGVRVGAISSGTFYLARAGLIGDARCTVHWEYLPVFREAFPQISVEDSLYVVDRGLCTCSGGVASADMMLAIIARRHGPEIAQPVANQYNIERIRGPNEQQRSGTMERVTTFPPTLQAAVDIIAANIEEPLSIADVCTRVGANPRRLERLFAHWLSTSPKSFYQRCRLEKARSLLVHSNLPIIDVAQMTGFATHSQFSVVFRRHFGETPTSLRRSAPDIGRERNGGAPWSVAVEGS